MRLHYIVFLLVVLLTSTIVRNEALSGQWNPIKDINDPHVIDLANYAVAEIDVPSHDDFKLKYIS